MGGYGAVYPLPSASDTATCVICTPAAVARFVDLELVRGPVEALAIVEQLWQVVAKHVWRHKWGAGAAEVERHQFDRPMSAIDRTHADHWHPSIDSRRDAPTADLDLASLLSRCA
jgi:hypothetical protein